MSQQARIMIVDDAMPGMSGFEVCVHLRKQAETKHLSIIFVSGLDSVQDRLEGFEAG